MSKDRCEELLVYAGTSWHGKIKGRVYPWCVVGPSDGRVLLLAGLVVGQRDCLSS